mmetsp:Transcript_11627/g.34467  ORF Transcript_11627/g.34467 Transcript_11627/m.34467 type:complete len:323 (-) Transcript_11627:137-1105(-)
MSPTRRQRYLRRPRTPRRNSATASHALPCPCVSYLGELLDEFLHPEALLLRLWRLFPGTHHVLLLEGVDGGDCTGARSTRPLARIVPRLRDAHHLLHREFRPEQRQEASAHEARAPAAAPAVDVDAGVLHVHLVHELAKELVGRVVGPGHRQVRDGEVDKVGPRYTRALGLRHRLPRAHGGVVVAHERTGKVHTQLLAEVGVALRVPQVAAHLRWYLFLQADEGCDPPANECPQVVICVLKGGPARIGGGGYGVHIGVPPDENAVLNDPVAEATAFPGRAQIGGREVEVLIAVVVEVKASAQRCCLHLELHELLGCTDFLRS